MKENDLGRDLRSLPDRRGSAHRALRDRGVLGLIVMARALGEREVVDLLSESLREEKETLKSLEQASRRLAKERVKAAAS